MFRLEYRNKCLECHDVGDLPINGLTCLVTMVQKGLFTVKFSTRRTVGMVGVRATILGASKLGIDPKQCPIRLIWSGLSLLC